MTEDKRDYTQFRSKEEFAKDLEEAKKLVKNSPTKERGELYRDSEDCRDFRLPKTEKALADYLRSEYLKSKVMYGNALSVGLSFATGSTNAVIKYAQTQDSLESFGYGLVTAIIAGTIAKAGSYILYERPLKKLEQTRTKLSILEK